MPTTAFAKTALALLSGASVFALTACGGSQAPERACLNGQPEAFFRAADSSVAQVNFDRSGQSSREDVLFADGQSLSISQVGCDTVIQTFELPTGREVESFPTFKRLAAERFRGYAQIDPRLYPFGQYARVLEAVPDEFPIGAPANLAPGLTVRAFRVPTTNGTTWQVRYEQDLTQVQRAQ